jgi:hypothetical protein
MNIVPMSLTASNSRGVRYWHARACVRCAQPCAYSLTCLTHTNFYACRYDRKTFEVRTIIDVIITGVMGPPGGGRTALTNRLMRHFNFIAFPEMGTRSLNMIFNTILSTWMRANFSNGEQVGPRSSRVTVYARVPHGVSTLINSLTSFHCLARKPFGLSCPSLYDD